MELSFPHATYVIQQESGRMHFTSPSSSSTKQEIFDFLQRNAQLRFIEKSGQLTDEISYELTGAHTPYHGISA